MPGAVLLHALDVRKAYEGVQALDGASFDLRAGEVHALVGENGAGKSTLVKILTGAVVPDAGEIRLDGTPVTQHTPRAARARGIAAIYQQPALFPELTVAENIAFRRSATPAWRRVDWTGMRSRATELLAEVSARIDPDAEASSLSMPEQQLVEIAGAVGADARVLVLDEPTASLGDDDALRLFAVVRRLRERGVGLIYISHRLEEIESIADRVTVLRDGRTIACRDMKDVRRDELIRLMVGRELRSVYPPREGTAGDVVLELAGLGCRSGGVHRVSLGVRAGEIVGLAGLVGAGRTELARTIFGLTPADAGEIRVRGKAVVVSSPADATAHGIAYVPEDRRRHGVLPEMTIAQNVSAAALGRASSHGWLVPQRETDLAVGFAERLGIKAASIHDAVSTLSGGNQQKVALARWLATKPDVLIVDEPTQGVDIGAKSEIHRLMRELARQGVAILMISSELPEILGMSDRVAVMRGGTIVDVLDGSTATQDEILSIALGHERSAA